MEKATSLIAALDAGKLPNQQQINQFIDWFLDSALAQVEPSDEGGNELSAQGKVLAGGVRDVLEAYKQLGSNKNGDNKLQEALWHLSAGDLSNTSVGVKMDTDDASTDIDAVRTALRTLLQVLWTNISSEGTSVLHDFASFARLALADAAEVVEAQAGHAKASLRDVEKEVQEGERDPLGRKKKTEEEEERDKDPKVKWEKGMDTAKGAGSTAIGAGQTAKAAAEDAADRTSSKIQEAYYRICERAQNDEAYQKSLSTLFDTVEKWLTRSLDTAADESQTSLLTLIDDPTPEQHVPKALHCLRNLIERLAGGKPLDDLFSHVRACAVDVREDPDLKQWFGQLFAHVRRSLEEPGYARSDEASRKFEELRSGWKGFLKEDSDKGRKWKKDVVALRRELSAFEEGMAKDKDLQRVRRAHAKLGRDIEEGFVTARSTGLQMAMDQASWFWQDVLKVYAPRVLGMLKDIPIPRTEYTDSDVEFVLEDLDVSSFNLLPGHVYIRNITDIDISAPAAASSTTAVGTLTHIRVQAMQLTLREVSFYYKDKTATIGPSEVTGLLEFHLPAQGVDIDLKVRLLPNTPEGLKQREQRGGFHDIEHVEVKIAEDVDVDVKQSNHAVVLTVFKPIFVMRFRDALEKALTEQIRASIQWIDAVAWDIGRRSEVFSDAGLGPGPALAAAFWSELGRLSKTEGGVLTGWKATGTGLVKDDMGEDGPKLALGAEPQILSGEKRGPKGTFADSAAEKMDVSGNGGSATEVAARGAQGAVGTAKEVVKAGSKKVKSFKQSVATKMKEEEKRDGWQSPAFDLDAK